MERLPAHRRQIRRRPRPPHRGSPREAYTRLNCWIRDLNEEGIEPHPGPRMISKNVNGMSKAVYQYLKSISEEHRHNPITAVFIQDHKIASTKAADVSKIAARLRLVIVMAHGKKDNRGVTHGGTAIIIPYDSIEANKKETHRAAIERVKKSRRILRHGRAVAIATAIDGKPRRLISAYAPTASQATVQERVAYFNSLKSFTTARSYVGIDANATPDPSLDRQGAPPGTQPSTAERALRDFSESNDLVDVARQSLGDGTFYSSHHIVAGGESRSRIDQLYAPGNGEEFWTHAPCTDFFPKKPNRLELDHIAISIEKEVTPQRKKGTALKRINPEVLESSTVVERLAGIIRKHARAPGDPRSRWETLKQEAANEMFEATEAKKFRASETLRQDLMTLGALRAKIKNGDATSAELQQADALERETAKSTRHEYTLFTSLESIAYSMGKAHDRCTKEFFRLWKPFNAHTTVPSIKKADWTNPSAPVFPGGSETTTKGILDQFTKYYKALFSRKTSDPVARRKCLEALRDGNGVLRPTSEACDADISEAETLEVLQHLPPGKSSGPDKIPNEFYKTFALLLAPMLTEVFNHSRRQGALPPTNMHARNYISPIQKKRPRRPPQLPPHHPTKLRLQNADAHPVQEDEQSSARIREQTTERLRARRLHRRKYYVIKAHTILP